METFKRNMPYVISQFWDHVIFTVHFIAVATIWLNYKICIFLYPLTLSSKDIWPSCQRIWSKYGWFYRQSNSLKLLLQNHKENTLLTNRKQGTFLVTDREFNHPIHQTTQNKSQYQQENTLFSIGRTFWQIWPGRYPHNQLCCSSHKCMILTSCTFL